MVPKGNGVLGNARVVDVVLEVAAESAGCFSDVKDTGPSPMTLMSDKRVAIRATEVEVKCGKIR